MDSIPEINTFLLIVFITTLGATVQGSVGLGLGFVAVPTLAIIDPAYLPGPLLLSALVLTVLISFREHKAIQFKGIRWAIGGRFLGAILGVQILVYIPKNYLSLIFATMVILGVILSVFGFRVRLNTKNLLNIGTLSGLMATTSAIGGPPLALIYQNLNGPELRGTLSGIFVAGTTISVILLAFIGRFGLEEIKLSFILMPGIIIGFFISKYTSKILDRGFIRPAVLVFSLTSGVILLIKTLI